MRRPLSCDAVHVFVLALVKFDALCMTRVAVYYI